MIEEKDAFIQRYEHEFEGWLFDAMSERRLGGEASMFMKAYRQRVRACLAKIFDDKGPQPKGTK